MTTTTNVTAEELLQWPDNGMRQELVRGKVIEMAPAGGEHGELAHEFGRRLGNFVIPNRLGKAYAAETGFILERNPDTVRAPDAAFARREVVAQFGRVRGYLPFTPDLVAEVISPNDTLAEVADKVKEWLGAGCRMVVVIDPRRYTVTVYRPNVEALVLTTADTLSGAEVVEGWELPVAELFAVLDED